MRRIRRWGRRGIAGGGLYADPVLAASSLTDAFGELEGMFEEQNQGVDVTTSFADSSELLVQIQQGAPADVLASADEAKMDTSVEEDRVNEPQIFVRNRPVVIVPADNSARIQSFRDLTEVDGQLVGRLSLAWPFW